MLMVFFVPSAMAGQCCAKMQPSQNAAKGDSQIDSILKSLNDATAKLKTYQCRVEYSFAQPLFDSNTLRHGVMYYKKDNNRSHLSLDFLTLKQDAQKQRDHRQQYFFDGSWLTYIDYPNKEVQKRQLSDPNKPKDAFELVRENFPIIGFGPSEDLKKQFDITLLKPAKPDANSVIALSLTVKPDSIYKDDYTTINFIIDANTSLPSQITAIGIDDEIYQIRFSGVKVNQPLPDKVFDVNIPSDFPKPRIITLNQEPKEKD